MPPAASRKPFHLRWFCDGVGMRSNDCKLDLVTVQGNLNGPRYQRDIPNTVDIPHFDNHALATRPVCMDDNAIPHRTLTVMVFYSEMQSLPFLDRHETPTSIQLRT